MEKTKKYILFFEFFVGGILLASLLILAGSRIPTTLGSAPSGLEAGSATSSQIAVASGTVTTPIATSTCAATIVGTASTTIMVAIGEMVPTASRGFFQAASTTKEYDGGIYGCGALKIYPFATGAITVERTN